MDITRVAAPPAYADRLSRLDRESIVIRSSLARPVLIVATCFVFASVGMVAAIRGEDDGLAVGLPAALVFGLGMVIAGLHIARPSTMTITAEGVAIRTILRSWTVRWDQVQGFFVYRAPAAGAARTLAGTDMVAFTWSRHTSETAWWSGIGHAPGLDGGFGSGWQLSARALADLLNAARTTALG